MHKRQADFPATAQLHALWSSLTRLSVTLSHLENDLQDFPNRMETAGGAAGGHDSRTRDGQGQEWLRAYA